MQCLYAGPVRRSGLSLPLPVRPSASDRAARAGRRLLAVPLVGRLTAVALLVAPAALLVAPALANAETQSTFKNLTVESNGGQALVIGTVAPGSGHVKGTVTVFARAVGEKGAFTTVASDVLPASVGNFAILAPLTAGSWEVKVRFEDRQQVVASTSHTVRVTIGAEPNSSIAVTSLNTKGKRFTLAGTTSPPGESGAKIELLMLNTAAGAPAQFKVFGTASFGTGKTTVTFRGMSAIPRRWELQLEYVRPGEAPSFSGLTAVAVK